MKTCYGCGIEIEKLGSHPTPLCRYESARLNIAHEAVSEVNEFVAKNGRLPKSGDEVWPE